MRTTKFKPIAPTAKEERYKQPEAEEPVIVKPPKTVPVHSLKEGQRVYIGAEIVKLVRLERVISKKKQTAEESSYLLHCRKGRSTQTEATYRRGADLIGVAK